LKIEKTRALAGGFADFAGVWIRRFFGSALGSAHLRTVRASAWPRTAQLSEKSH
jgi:hypothetical protein